MSKLQCTRLLRMSPDWIKFDTHLIISVQLLIRKRKVEKYSYVFKKKKSNNEQNESDRIWNINFPSSQLFRERLRKKCTRQSRKVLWVVLNPLNMSNAGDFSLNWILKDFIQVKKRRKIRCRMSASFIKREIRRFQVVVVQWTSKKWTKKSDASAELLFWSLNLLFFEVVVVVVVVA